MATVSVQEPLPISQLNGLRLSEEENNPEIETKLENVEINQNVKNESKPSSVLSSSPQPSTPTSGKDEPSSSSETDHNDGGEGIGQDVVGAVGETHERDAGPFNIAAYNRRLPAGVRDERYGSWDIRKYETFTAEESSEYDLSRGEKLVVIFNHQEFIPSRNLPRRNGTERDCQSIDKTFKSLGFKIHRYDDLSVYEIKNVIFEIQRYENLACLALFILTHGEENGLLFGRDTNYRLNKDIVNELLPQQCASLAGKPKLIFVQACQGVETDGGTKLHAVPSLMSRSRHTSTDGEAFGNSYCIPNYADFLIFQAAYHGHYSFRSASGSWFIQSLCTELDKSVPEEDLLTVLTRVTRNVAITRSSNVPHDFLLHDKKQIPLRQDTLLRSIYLKRGMADKGATPIRQARTNTSTSSDRATAGQEPEEKKMKRKKPDKDLCDIM